MDKFGVINPGVTPQPRSPQSKTANEKEVTAEQLDDGLLLDMANAVESRQNRSSLHSPGADSVRKANDV